MHRRRRWLIGIGAVVVVIVVIGSWVTFGGQRAQPSSEDQARARLAPATGPTAGSQSSPGSPPGTGVAPAGGAASALTGAPIAGLYRYQGSGHERTSFPPLAEDQGPAMPATVTVDADGCWVLQIDYNTHHWQNWTYCTANGELREKRGATFSRRVLGTSNIDNTSEFVCEPVALITAAADRPGTSRPRSCTGKGSLVPNVTTVAGTMTVVGDEVIDVGGAPVPSVHVRHDLTYTGGQTGTETSEQWFATSTGLPLRNEHHIAVNTDTPFGPITYTEDAQFALQTASPV